LQNSGNDDGGTFRGKLLGFGPLQPWELDAACYDVDQAIFFGGDWEDDGERPKHSVRRTKLQTQLAAAICKTCPVLDNCRAWAIEQGPPYGYLAGMTEAERLRNANNAGS
jgi:WhiB family redox-sensing transcriptional regulator